jgi:hypothetical protein
VPRLDSCLAFGPRLAGFAAFVPLGVPPSSRRGP